MGGAPRSAVDVAAAVAAGESTARAVTQRALAGIVERESSPARLNAFISFDRNDALRQADAVDARLAALQSTADDAVRVLPLAGVPVAVKDNICTHGLPTTCGSRMLADFHAPFEATAVRRLRAAGAIIAGKTNLDEFGMGTSTETSVFGPARNPHDPGRVAGGSSGGSAAAVAAGLVSVALGSDTGGSVRQPAAFCGIVGLRPTWGRVSRYGLVSFASSLDQLGVLAADVRDAALVLRCMAGADPYDATSATLPVPDYVAAAEATGDRPLHSLVVGRPREYFAADLDGDVRRACDGAIGVLRRLGATIRDVSLPHTALALPAYSAISAAEASSNLARFDGVRYGTRPQSAPSLTAMYRRSRARGFGAEVKRRILLGSIVLGAEAGDDHFAAAQRARALIARDFAAAFAGVDLLFTPTTPHTAFRIGSMSHTPLDMHASDRFAVAASLSGLPALSLPIGRAAGLPIGGQLIGRQWDEAMVLTAAAALERELRS